MPRQIETLTWMVKAMPMKEAVSRETPTDPGPTMLSCCMVLRQWMFPVTVRMATYGRTGRGWAFSQEHYCDKFQIMMSRVVPGRP